MLPNFVCVECWEKTESFHRFHRSVYAAQENFLSGLVKCEIKNDVDESLDSEQTNFVEEHTNINEISTLTEQPSAPLNQHESNSIFIDGESPLDIKESPSDDQQSGKCQTVIHF